MYTCRYLPVSIPFTLGECSPAIAPTMKPRTYRTLDAFDPDLEVHVVLLLARMSRDLYVMLYEPPNLSTPESAADSAVSCDRLLVALESYHRTIKVLRNLLQEKQRRLTLPRKTPPTRGVDELEDAVGDPDAAWCRSSALENALGQAAGLRLHRERRSSACGQRCRCGRS